MVTKREKKPKLCNCNYCIFFFTFLLRLFHYFDYKTWAGNKTKKINKNKTRGSFNQIDMGFDSSVAFAVLWPRFFSR